MLKRKLKEVGEIPNKMSKQDALADCVQVSFFSLLFFFIKSFLEEKLLAHSIAAFST
jgi:hypothetical protein